MSQQGGAEVPQDVTPAALWRRSGSSRVCRRCKEKRKHRPPTSQDTVPSPPLRDAGFTASAALIEFPLQPNVFTNSYTDTAQRGPEYAKCVHNVLSRPAETPHSEKKLRRSRHQRFEQNWQQRFPRDVSVFKDLQHTHNYCRTSVSEAARYWKWQTMPWLWREKKKELARLHQIYSFEGSVLTTDFKQQMTPNAETAQVFNYTHSQTRITSPWLAAAAQHCSSPNFRSKCHYYHRSLPSIIFYSPFQIR
nr:uncharacterized protein LOC110359242 isoform X2 [Columba livia]